MELWQQRHALSCANRLHHPLISEFRLTSAEQHTKTTCHLREQAMLLHLVGNYWTLWLPELLAEV
jgi:hypothetical protein